MGNCLLEAASDLLFQFESDPLLSHLNEAKQTYTPTS